MAKGLFWMFVGPALWAAILLLIASDTVHGVVEIAELSAEPGIFQSTNVLPTDTRSSTEGSHTILSSNSSSRPGRNVWITCDSARFAMAYSSSSSRRA